MKISLTSLIFACLAVTGCQKDTLGKRNAPQVKQGSSSLILLKVTNTNYPSPTKFPGPNGLTVSVPSSCKKVPKDPNLLAQISSSNIPVEIETEDGARLSWFYQKANDAASLKSIRDLRALPQASKSPTLSFGNWTGHRSLQEGGYVNSLDPKSSPSNGTLYIMFQNDDFLRVVVRWPVGNAEAEASGIALAESFIKTVEIDPTAKKVELP